MRQYITAYNSFKTKEAIILLSYKVEKIIEERGAENCILLTVLEGGAYLASKIINRLPQDMLASLETASIKVSSYHGSERGEIRESYIPNLKCQEKTIIVIDDFCDSGTTTNYLDNLYRNQYKAKDVIIVTLLARKKRKLNDSVNLLYGIEDNTDNFYIGCGMDEDNRSRYVDTIMTYTDNEER